MTVESAIKLGLMSESRVLEHINAHGSLTIAKLAELIGASKRGLRVVVNRLIEKEQVYKVPMTAPAEFSLDPAYAGKATPQTEEDDGKPIRVIRQVGSWRAIRPAVPRSVFELGAV